MISQFYQSFEAHAKRDGLTIGRCHMGSCGAFRVLRTETLGRAKLGRLVKARVQDFGAEYAHPRRIERSRPTAIYLYCSREVPGFISKVREVNGSHHWYFQRLAGLSGAGEYITAVYLRICYGLDLHSMKWEEALKFVPERKREPLDVRRLDHPYQALKFPECSFLPSVHAVVTAWAGCFVPRLASART